MIINNEVAFNQVKLLCDKYNLDTLLAYLIGTNRGFNNLYHNTSHCINVAYIATEILRRDFTINMEDHPLEKILFAASLLHDYNHTGSSQVSDAFNIEEALNGLDYFCKLYPKVFNTFEVDKIKSIISVTQFPFVTYPTFDIHKCIRDADILYATCHEDGVNITLGLMAEMNNIDSKKISKDDTSSLLSIINYNDLEKFVQNNKNFLLSTIKYTPTGTKLFNAYKDNHFNRLSQLL